MSIFDAQPLTSPLPPKLREIIAEGWTFPVDFPVVDNINSPDATRTLRAVIIYSLQNFYYDHRLCMFNQDDFTRHLQNRLYNKMSQHQYWIDEYLKLIEDSQFFYNEEWNDGGTQTTETGERNTASNTTSSNNGLMKRSDTPQNSVSDINQYLSEAQIDENAQSGNEDINEDMSNTSNFSTTLHTKRSTLGDITVQFNNFARFPNFIDQLIEAVRPCFLTYYGDEDIDYGTTE